VIAKDWNLFDTRCERSGHSKLSKQESGSGIRLTPALLMRLLLNGEGFGVLDEPLIPACGVNIEAMRAWAERGGAVEECVVREAVNLLQYLFAIDPHFDVAHGNRT